MATCEQLGSVAACGMLPNEVALFDVIGDVASDGPLPLLPRGLRNEMVGSVVVIVVAGAA